MNSNRSWVLLPTVLLASTLSAHQGEEQKLLASDGLAGDAFGSALSVFDETILAGAPNADAFGADSGAAYVFVHAGTFIEEAKLVASDAAAGDLFGTSVSIYGDLAVVGAPAKADNGADSGAAYVFLRTGSVWTQEAKLTPSVAAAGDSFGASVSIYEETVIVGAPQNASGATGNGTAFVFVRSGTSWSEEAQISSATGMPQDAFGISVSAGLDRVAIGAELGDGVVVDSGAAYVYTRSGSVWSLANTLTASDGAAQDQFGTSVSLWENYVAVGAPGHDEVGADSGASYVFIQVGLNYSLKQEAAGTGAGDRFGEVVSYNHRSLVSGSRFDDDESPDAGAFWLHQSIGAGKFEIFVANDPDPSDLLGFAGSSSDCWLAAGAIGDDELALDAGAVYVYAVASASATVSNGTGVNPICMTTTQLPVIGEDWIIEVDATAFPGAASTQVVGFAQVRQTPVTFTFGEVIVNTATPMYFSLTTVGGGVNTHSFPVPLSAWVSGFNIAIQGVVRDAGSLVLSACNAEVVTVGCHSDE